MDASIHRNEEFLIQKNNSESRNKLKRQSNSAFPNKSIIEENNEVFLTENALKGKSYKKSKNRMKSGKSDLTTRPNTGFKANLRPKSSLIGYYLTHNKFFKKENFSIESKLIDIENYSTKNKNVVSEFNENMGSCTSQKLEEMENGKNRFNFSERHNMCFKDMLIAKNNDKIIKTGVFGVLPSHSYALKGLVDQTNKLFLYKQKTTLKPESKNIFNKFQKNIDKKFKILKGIKADFKPEHYEMGDHIVSDIEAMINNLVKKE